MLIICVTFQPYEKVAEITEEPALKTQMLENASHLAEGELAIRANFLKNWR